MKIISTFILFIYSIFFVTSLNAQDNWKVVDYTLSNLEKTYALIPGLPSLLAFNNDNGVFPEKDDKGKDAGILLEIQLVPHFIYEPFRKFFLIATPKVNIRQLTNNSKPVRTPGFMPAITFVFALEDSVKLINRKKSRPYFSIKFQHNSNGQVGDFLKGTNATTSTTLVDNINLIDGNFSTNFFEFGVHWPLRKLYVNPAIEYHLIGQNELGDKILHDTYGRLRVNLNARLTLAQNKWIFFHGKFIHRDSST